jgi:cytochrome c556
MVGLVDHASHTLWDVEKEGRAPKTDADWGELEHHAIQLAAAGPLIALGGTGQADPGWAQSPAWKKYSQELADAGVAALNAVRSKNLEALVKANGQLVDVCERCHKEFKPELPTEGIVHPHVE